MKSEYRKWLLGTMLTLTLLSAYLVGYREDSAYNTVLAKGQDRAKPRNETNYKNISLSKFDSAVYAKREFSEPKVDIFHAKVTPEVKKQELHTNVPAAIVKPQIVMPVVVQPPSAPAIPFKYLGKYLDEERGLVVFLNLNNRNLIVKSGDLIQQTYRIDEIKPPTLTMTYLPMNIKQTINIGDIN